MRKVLAVPSWCWLALGLALRVGFVLKLGGRLYQIDEGAYDSAAWSLASTGALGPPGTVFPPIPPAFFAFFFLPGHHLLLPRLAQACLSLATAWLIGRMARDLISEAAGKAALALASIYPFFIYYGGLLLSETLYLAFALPGLWALGRSAEDQSGNPRLPAAGGFLLGAAALCRPEAAPIACLLWAAAGAACLAGRLRWKGLAAALLCWSIPLGLWCARNKAEVGRFKLDTHGGISLLHGTLLFDYNEVDTGVAMKALAELPFYAQAQALSPADRDDFYARKGLEFMREHPGETLRQWGRKLVNFWRFYPRADKTFIESATSHPGAGLGRGALTAISLAFEPALILLGLFGLWGRKGSAAFLPLWLFLIGTMGIHMASVSQMRYRLPVMPLLMLGACGLAGKAQSKKR